MSHCRVVSPEVVRITISDGDWIEVKKVLNAGEYRKLLYDQFKDAPDGTTVTLDHAKLGITKLLAYLLGWSLIGVHDHPIPYGGQPEDMRRAALDSLDQDTYRELIAAVAAHEAQQEAALDAKKKRRGYREAIVNDLAIAARMHWKYEWVSALPRDVYTILVEELNK